MVSDIKNVMTKHVITLHKGSTVAEAVKLMAKHTISCVIVVDKGFKPIGIITERDMVKRVLKNKLDTNNTKIGDVMTVPVITLPANRRITDAVNLMHKYHFRRIVVVTTQNKLLGILTQSDLLMEVHKVQLELEKMNDHLRNTVNSLKRYKKETTAQARIKDLKKKISGLEKAMERAQKAANNSIK
jgi:CBS domain-containing protein